MLTPARDIAFKVLLRVETELSYAVELLNSTLTQNLSPADRGLAQEITMGCLRWQEQLDWLAAHYSGKLPARWDPEVRVAVRMGTYQIRFLERIPSSAAVNQSVALVKAARKRSAAGLVNAVLRKVDKTPLRELLPQDLPEAERMVIELSHPAWLLARWIDHFGLDRATEIARINNAPPPTFVRLPPGTTVEDGKPCRYVKNCRETSTPGMFQVQDEASQIVPYLVAPGPRDRVLDLCSAPGVKTGALKELAPDAWLVACDVRLSRWVRELAGDVPRVVLDGTRPLPFAIRFDRILVDAPCSGTGTIRRNPEIKWRAAPKDLPLLAARQRWLLNNALDALAPGGCLVYSTCSIEPEENQAVIEEVLKSRPDCHLVPVENIQGDFLTEEGRGLLKGKYFQTLPDQGVDGFFAALLEK